MTGPDSYRERVAAALAGGWRFAGLHASSHGAVVRALLADRDGALRLEDAVAEGGAVPSIVDLVPAAGWDEREAADLYGLVFEGHNPLRPLLDHGAAADRWTVRVSGADAYELAVGPIHAGVIESGHFRFRVVGDRMLHVDARLFYKHRGLEKAAEGRTLEEGAAYVGRACAACAGHERRARTRTPARRRSGSSRRTSSPACGRSSSSWSGHGAISTTSPPSAPAWVWPPATTSSRRSPSAPAG